MKEGDFFKYKNNIKPASGCFLVSEPHLPDTNFDRTVILLCKHDEEGSFGFVLNKKSNLTFNEVINEAEKIRLPVFIGGPVEQNTLNFIHSDETIVGSELVSDNLYWGGDFDLILNWLNEKVIDGQNIRFFLGYSGWSAGQLMEEIEQNSWMVYKPSDSNIIFTTDLTMMWKTVLEEMGGRFSVYSKYPVDPRLN